MDLKDFFKDYLPPLATLTAAMTAALVAGIFAYRQSKISELQAEIALDKLKYDTIDKRIDVMNALIELIKFSYLSHQNPNPEFGYMQMLRDRIAKGRFYFNAEIVQYTNSIVYNCIDATMPLVVPSIRELAAMPEHERLDILERRKTKDDAFKKIAKEHNLIPSIFEKEIGLNFLKSTTSISPGSSKYVKIAYSPIIYACYAVISILSSIAIGLASFAVVSSGP